MSLVLSSVPTQIPTTVSTQNELISYYVCAPYSASNTNSDRQNYATCSYTLPAIDTSATVTASVCGNYNGDTYLRAYINNTEVAFNNDHCDQGSSMSFLMTAGQTVVIREECYGNTYCSGTVVLTISSLNCNMSSIQYSALQDLYTSTNGPNWDPDCNFNWLFSSSTNMVGSSPCHWPGITCNSQCEVTSLSLGECNLHGSIPSSIGNLVNLTSLSLYDNSLSRSIPSSIGNLVSLQALGLYDNFLSGSIPSSIGSLANLTYLNLDSNHLYGSVPSSIGNLNNLYYLDLGYNQLSGSIPTSIEKLVNLAALILNNNNLDGSLSTTQLCNMHLLEIMFLHENVFTGTIPSCIFSLPSLQGIKLSNNSGLTGHLPSLITTSSSRKLQYVFLDSINLYGSIPDSLFDLPHLISLVLSSNCITGSIPESICSATSMNSWSLILNGAFDEQQCSRSGNKFRSSLPSCIFASPNLTTLHLAGNKLLGRLPNIPMSSSIQDLNLASNLLTGILTITIYICMRIISSSQLLHSNVYI